MAPLDKLRIYREGLEAKPRAAPSLQSFKFSYNSFLAVVCLGLGSFLFCRLTLNLGKLVSLGLKFLVYQMKVKLVYLIWLLQNWNDSVPVKLLKQYLAKSKCSKHVSCC